MRHLSVLTVMALLAGTAFAGGISATDPPDIRLLPGAAAENVFDMNDFISGTSFSGDVIDANGIVSVPGSSDVGLTDFAVSVDGAEVVITRKVSSFMLEGAPDCDDNMVLVDQAAGSNVFLNCLRAGVAVNSAVNLTGGPEPGAGGSPSNGSPPVGGAAWIVTLGTACGSSAVVAQGEGEASFGGLTASIDADGAYTLVSDDSFAGAMAVTFVKKAGDDMDAATVVAAAAVDAGGSYAVNDMDAGTEILVASGVASYSFDGKLNVTMDAGAVGQVYFNAVEVGGPVNVSVMVEGDLGVSIALMDSNFSDLTYMFASGPGEWDAGTARRISATFDSPSGSIIPVLQIAGGAGGSVTFDDMQICAAPCCPMKGVQLTQAFVATPFAGDFSGGLDGAYQDINGQAGSIGYNTPAVVDGACELSAAGTSLSNITLSAAVAGPAVVVISCDAKVVSAAGGGASGLFQFVGGSANADLGSTNFGTFVNAGTLGADWSAVKASCPVQSAALAAFTVTAQAAIGVGDPAADTLTVAVDNIGVAVVDTNPLFFDATLLGS